MLLLLPRMVVKGCMSDLCMGGVEMRTCPHNSCTHRHFSSQKEYISFEDCSCDTDQCYVSNFRVIRWEINFITISRPIYRDLIDETIKMNVSTFRMVNKDTHIISYSSMTPLRGKGDSWFSYDNQCYFFREFFFRVQKV